MKKLQTTIVEPTGQEHFIDWSILQGWRSKKPSFGKNNYQGFDEQTQNIGLKTDIDTIKIEDINPMDTHWKGDAATKKSIENGDFVGRTRNLNNPFLEEKILKKHNSCN